MAKYIDAEKLIGRLKKDPLYPFVERYRMIRVLEAEPAADVQEVRHGRWEEADDMPRLDNTFTIRCSLCGQLMLAHPNEENPNFCCNCGARMDLDEVTEE